MNAGDERSELRASRARIVVRDLAERAAFERALHDGVQQHLVALAVNLQLARQLLASDPPALAALLDDLGRDVHDALESVRLLAQRIYPPLLHDRGLVEALRAAADAAALPARVDADDVPRYPPEVEAAAYLGCLEALENAALHAGPDARAVVRVRSQDGALRFEVIDDGPGFDAELEPHGGGLTEAIDRVAALGGRLTVVSAPGRGTQVAGTIPLAR